MKKYMFYGLIGILLQISPAFSIDLFKEHLKDSLLNGVPVIERKDLDHALDLVYTSGYPPSSQAKLKNALENYFWYGLLPFERDTKIRKNLKLEKNSLAPFRNFFLHNAGKNYLIAELIETFPVNELEWKTLATKIDSLSDSAWDPYYPSLALAVQRNALVLVNRPLCNVVSRWAEDVLMSDTAKSTYLMYTVVPLICPHIKRENITFLLSAADRGFSLAQFHLACWLYLQYEEATGQRDKNYWYQLTMKYLKMAADSGMPEAVSKLAEIQKFGGLENIPGIYLSNLAEKRVIYTAPTRYDSIEKDESGHCIIF